MATISDAKPQPLWRESVQRRWDAEPAPKRAHVDIAIVGGGLSGLWSAYYFLQRHPNARVAILESQEVGFGASGRNGGWCSGFFPSSPDELADVFGARSAMDAYRASFDTLPEIERVLRTEGIVCDWHHGGTIQSASTALQAGRLSEMVDRQHAVGLAPSDMQWLPPSRVGEHLTLAETHGAVYSPHCATVNPYALTTGLAEALRRRGVQLWEHSKVVSIDDGHVRHSHGSLTADLVVQATEGYSHALKPTRRRLAPLYSLMVATAPLTDSMLSAIGWRNRVTFNDGGRMIIYAQLTADNRIAFGGRGAPYHFASRVHDRYDLDSDTHRRIAAAIAQHFPIAATARITHRWGGPLGVPRDWTPSVTLDRARHYARIGGYVGDGVAATNLFARMLVDAWLGTDSSLTRLPFVQHRSPKWEVEPLRFLGINSLLRLSESIDRYEQRHGREPRIRTKFFESLL